MTAGHGIAHTEGIDGGRTRRATVDRPAAGAPGLRPRPSTTTPRPQWREGGAELTSARRPLRSTDRAGGIHSALVGIDIACDEASALTPARSTPVSSTG